MKKLICKMKGHKWGDWVEKLFEMEVTNVKLDVRECQRCPAKEKRNVQILPTKKVDSDGTRNI